MNIFSLVECITHFIDKRRDATLDETKIIRVVNNFLYFLIINMPNFFVQIMLDSFSQHVKNIQSNELKENIILYKQFDKAFGLYFLTNFFLTQLVFISGPFLTTSSLPSIGAATQNDHLRIFSVFIREV